MRGTPVRTIPALEGSERDLLASYLDFQRETVLMKAEGLTGDQMAQALAPSTLTLGGLLNHLALVEDSWMQVRFLGKKEAEPWAGVDWKADPDWDFHRAAELAPGELQERYRAACERSRDVLAEASSLDDLSVKTLGGKRFSLRWVVLHLIEETARHAGHADLLRQAIDGVVGE
jgi:uncharacterized damage-inducible protein DinB